MSKPKMETGDLCRMGCNCLIEGFQQLQEEHGKQDEMTVQFERDGELYHIVIMNSVAAAKAGKFVIAPEAA